MTSAPPATDPSSTRKTFTIGTRKSKLALLQTDLVLAALKETCPDCSFQIHSRETAGDQNTNIALREFATKNLWTEELEELLIAGQVDIIVHSLKGMCLRLVCMALGCNETDISCDGLSRCANPPSHLVYTGSHDEAGRQQGCSSDEARIAI